MEPNSNSGAPSPYTQKKQNYDFCEEDEYFEQNCDIIINFKMQETLDINKKGILFKCSGPTLSNPNKKFSIIATKVDRVIEFSCSKYIDALSEYVFDFQEHNLIESGKKDKIKNLFKKNIDLYTGLEKIISTLDANVVDKDALDLMINTLNKFHYQILMEKLKLVDLGINFDSKVSANPLDLAVTLGNEILKNPKFFINKYLEIDEKIYFTLPTQPNNSSLKILKFLTKVNESIDKSEDYVDSFIALEAFAMNALHSYIVNPKGSLDPNYSTIIEILNKIKENCALKIAKAHLKDTQIERNKNIEFYTFFKKTLEENKEYSQNFWHDPNLSKKMNISDPILDIIRGKTANPLGKVDKSAKPFHKNEELCYEIYYYSDKKGKNKLLLFVHEVPIVKSNYILPGILPVIPSLPWLNSNIDLCGDYKILEHAEKIYTDIISKKILNECLSQLEKGDIEIISSGFDNQGCTATIVSCKLAELFPKTEVTSLAMASTEFVSAEDAFNMKAKNFFPIMLKSPNDRRVERGMITSSYYSNKSYNRFPLNVKYNAHTLDYSKHNISEYGSVDNFVPAMKNPLILHSLYEICLLPNTIGKDQNNQLQLQSLILISEEISGKLSKQISNKEIPTIDGFLVFDKNSDKFIQKKYPFINQEEDTIFALKQTLQLLQLNVLSSNDLYSLLISCNSSLIYDFTNKDLLISGGNRAELVGIISEIRSLVMEKLTSLNNEDNLAFNPLQNNTLKTLSKMIKNHVKLIQKGDDKNILVKDILSKGLLDKVDFEDQFLNFLAFKITSKQNSKIGTEHYINNLGLENSDPNNKFNIALYSPNESHKKERIVITCTGEEVGKSHGNINGGDFGAGEIKILDRALDLQAVVLETLTKKFIEYNFNSEDIEIVVIGYGSEGAVATALGFYLSKEFEGCQVTSIGFGAPKFTTIEGAKTIKDQTNFIPIRFQSPQDSYYNPKLPQFFSLPLVNETYCTIPIQFRAPGMTEWYGHNTTLYGDTHAIKRAMKSIKQMNDIAKSGANISTPKAPDTTKIAKRIQVDANYENLVIYSNMTCQELQNVSPANIIRIIEYCSELSVDEDLTFERKQLVKKFFDLFIKSIRNEDTTNPSPFFDLMVSKDYRADLLFGGKIELQRIISDNLHNAILNLKKGASTDKQKNEQILSINFHRGILAGDLNGNQYKSAGDGVNGALFFTKLEWNLKLKDSITFYPWEDLNNKTQYIGVFKPHPKSVKEKGNAFGNLPERVKETLGMAAHLNKKDVDRRVHNEIFAYELFHAFGFDKYIGFPVTLEISNKNDSKGRLASFCEFLPGFDKVEVHVKRPNKSGKTNNLNDSEKKFEEQELLLWQLSKIFDYITGNMDGHDGNAFVQFDAKNKLINAVNFDYDKALPAQEPIIPITNAHYVIRNQYQWGELAISQWLFIEKALTILETMIEKKDIFLKNFKENIKCENWDNSQEKLLNKRLDTLKRVISREIKNLSMLAETKKIKES